ncbi:GTPase IMAP family member 9-like [Myxocyprinus asiaticus]|uniref:GTPase IMAP family member 9-like n=1 Tax=Myxocyprinus asiaticus TaxID=70543 RepID=UPI002221771F|nr:GTPase IMAP family member 9-like [Myxocyprinus asiaticus]
MAEKDESAAADGSAAVRLVLLGPTGSGRSSAGNTILGRAAFCTDVSPVSVTNRCQRAGGCVEGWSLEVIDTPGFFHTCLTPDETRTELRRCVDLSEPGPHVFLLVLRPCRQTREQNAALDCFSATFGPQAFRYTIALITCGDTLNTKPVEDFLKESEELWALVSRCAGGYHVFDNTKGHEERSQVTTLLSKADLLIQRNAGAHYTCDMFLQAVATARHVQQRILGEGAEEFQRSEEVGQRRQEEEDGRKRAESLFWYEFVTAMGRGAVEASGVLEKGKGKGKKVKAVQRAAAIASTPLSITTAAKVMGGAMREGTKVLYKHKKTLLHKQNDNK